MVLKLSERFSNIQLTPIEALEKALGSEYLKHTQEVIILMHSDKDESEPYEFYRGGGISNERTVWHLLKHLFAILDGRLKVF